MEFGTLFFIATALVGLYMAWNIGANDVANSMASAVGARAITLGQAVVIAGLLDFIGAVFVGSHVTHTVTRGIVDPGAVGSSQMVVLGAFSILLAASGWVFLATWKGFPVSTTHSIVGALIGFGLVAGNASAIRWGKLGEVVASWVTSPILSGFLAFFLFKSIEKLFLRGKRENLRRLSPYLVGGTFLIIFLSLFLKTPLGKNLGLTSWERVFLSLLGASLAGVGGWFWVSRYLRWGEGRTVEDVFRNLQIMTSCYVAFAQGANDVANAVGPIATVRSLIINGGIGEEVKIPFWLLAFGGGGIALGILTWGYRVIKTVGSQITDLTNTRGFAIDFSTATIVLLCSKLGLPVSTTHACVGAVVGVGLGRGLEAIDLRVVKRIVISWVVTVPLAAILAMGFYGLLTRIML